MLLDCFYKGGFSSSTVNVAAAMAAKTPVTADCSVNKLASLNIASLMVKMSCCLDQYQQS